MTISELKESHCTVREVRIVLEEHILFRSNSKNCEKQLLTHNTRHTQSGALLTTLDLHNTTCCHITKLL